MKATDVQIGFFKIHIYYFILRLRRNRFYLLGGRKCRQVDGQNAGTARACVVRAEGGGRS